MTPAKAEWARLAVEHRERAERTRRERGLDEGEALVEVASWPEEDARIQACLGEGSGRVDVRRRR